MKKIISLLLVVVCLFSFSACGPKKGPGERHSDIHNVPENCIEMAPWEFYLEWDIPSVRDGYAEHNEDYSMPVYRFDTYEELAHLKEIVGRETIGEEDPYPTTHWGGTEYAYTEYCQYDEEFFEKYSLLIGWNNHSYIQIKEEYINGYGETIRYRLDYSISRDGLLSVQLDGERSENSQPQWILVAVPKDQIANCNSIAFFVSVE